MNNDLNSVELPMSNSDHNLLAIASRLRYIHRCGQEVDPEITQARGMTIVDASRLGNCPGARLLLDRLGKGVLVIENTVNKRSVYSDKVYAIAKPTGSQCAPQAFSFTEVGQVTSVLQAGYEIGFIREGLFYKTLGPADAPNLRSSYDNTANWNKLVAAVLNINIENDSDWTTGGLMRENLTKLVGKETISVPSGLGFIEQAQMDADEFAYTLLERRLEPLMCAVFTFTSQEPAAFYHATAHPRGVCVTRYNDVRAFLWHFQTVERLLCEEQAQEEGLG